MRGLLVILMMCVGWGSVAMADDGVARVMEEHLWTERVLLVFAPSSDSDALAEQRAIMAAHQDGFEDRDMAVWELVAYSYVALNGEVKAHLPVQAFQRHFDVSEDAFEVILLGKDGEEKLRQSEPLSAEALFGLIDSMPMRQREMRSTDTE
ncbi:MAG: hypothetical protein CMM94_06245 [Rickettsiales bacterium]|nr:hypothetical protein [Rickettsiales bacterium]